MRGEATYHVTGHCPAVFGTTITNQESGVTLNFGGFRLDGTDTSDPDYNFAYNNFHLVNNSLAYPTSSQLNSASNGWTTSGPSFAGFIAPVASIGQAADLFWHSAFVVSAANRQGIQGFFGNYQVYDSSTEIVPFGLAAVVSGLVVRSLERYYFLAKAGSNVFPPTDQYETPQASNPGAETTPPYFWDASGDGLNVLLRPLQKGIDVVNVKIISKPCML